MTEGIAGKNADQLHAEKAIGQRACYGARSSFFTFRDQALTQLLKFRS